jgi:hypothetical protein
MEKKTKAAGIVVLAAIIASAGYLTTQPVVSDCVSACVEQYDECLKLPSCTIGVPVEEINQTCIKLCGEGS